MAGWKIIRSIGVAVLAKWLGTDGLARERMDVASPIVRIPLSNAAESSEAVD